MYMWSCERYTEIYIHTNTPYTFSHSEIRRIIAVQRKTWGSSTQKHILPFLAPHTGLAYSRSLINTDWMNAEVEWRDLEAHRVISRNLKHAELMLFVCPQLEIFFPSSHPFLSPKSLVFFFSFAVMLYFMNRSRFSGASFGSGRMFVVGKERKIEEQLLFDIGGNPQI